MGSWGGWILGSALLGLGVLCALAALVLGVTGALGGDDAEGAAHREAATPVALAALAIVLAGACLRWSGTCCGDDCCDWDEKRPNATLQRSG